MGITTKQKEVFDYIKTYTHTNGYAPTQKEIKEHFGFKSFGSVQRYIKYLVNANYLYRDWNARQGLKILKDDNNPVTEIPLFGDVAAGIPIEAIENPTETINVPEYMLRAPHRYYALTVQGSSMIDDHILDGDIIVCKWQQQATRGQTVVAVIDGEATVKKFHPKSDCIELHPANKTMSPIIVDPDRDFRIVGVIVGLVRSY